MCYDGETALARFPAHRGYGMAYLDADGLTGKSTGVVVPMRDGRGNPYPEYLRTQQVGLRVARAVCDRLEAALCGPPGRPGRRLKLATATIDDVTRPHVKAYLLSILLRELFGDPIPATIEPARQIVSPKAISLLNDRLEQAFDPPGGVLRLPGITLQSDDLFDLLTLVTERLLGDDRFPVRTTILPVPPPTPTPDSPSPTPPVAPTVSPVVDIDGY